MSKEDMINVYFFDGLITHDLSEVKNHIDFMFKDAPNTLPIEFPMKVYRERVGEYVWTNQYNLSTEEVEDLATKHGFTLEDIDWENRDFECAARGYKRK